MDKKKVTFYVDGFNFYYGLKRKKQVAGAGNASTGLMLSSSSSNSSARIRNLRK